MENQRISITQKIEQSTAAQLPAIPEVAARFQELYTIMQGGKEEHARAMYDAERFHFAKIIQDNPKLQGCTKLSLYGCFLDMAVNGLSFDPGRKLAYIVPFNTKVAGTDQWESRASLMITGYGELHMRMRQGQIKYADNPVLVYDGDQFSFGTKGGHVFLDHVATFPRKSDKIIACYIRLERADGSVDYKVLSVEEVEKIRKFSKDPNSKAWTDGFPGMIQSKTIKHAFRSYPKMRMGQFTQLASNTIDQEEDVQEIDYGLNGSSPEPSRQEPPRIPPDDSFAPVPAAAPGKSNGVVHQDDAF